MLLLRAPAEACEAESEKGKACRLGYHRDTKAIETEAVASLIGKDNGLAGWDCVVAGKIIDVKCGGNRDKRERAKPSMVSDARLPVAPPVNSQNTI